MAPNKTLVFKKIPTGVPVAGEHLAVEDQPIDIDTPPKNGLVLEVLYASFDPYMRGKMRDASVESYAPAFELGKGMENTVVATVLKSDNPEYREGETVQAFVPIAQYARIEDVKAAQLQKINNPHNLDVALFLGPLGMPGLTAWSSLYKIGKPKKGETIFVSSAAGAVGQVVGQVAKREGLTVIGSVGSDAKLEFITKELGFDAGFNYKKESPFDALKRLAPDGIDIYYENVGGDHLEAALENMKFNGRIPICGMVSLSQPKPFMKLHFLTLFFQNRFPTTIRQRKSRGAFGTSCWLSRTTSPCRASWSSLPSSATPTPRTTRRG